MFDDRFEIFSYEKLPYGITQDMIFNGYSRPINRGLFTIKYAFNLLNSSDIVVENVVENSENVVENDTLEQVFNEIKKNTNISANDIANILNKNPRTKQRAIAALKQANRIKRVGPDKGGHWEIIS